MDKVTTMTMARRMQSPRVSGRTFRKRVAVYGLALELVRTPIQKTHPARQIETSAPPGGPDSRHRETFITPRIQGCHAGDAEGARARACASVSPAGGGTTMRPASASDESGEIGAAAPSASRPGGRGPGGGTCIELRAQVDDQDAEPERAGRRRRAGSHVVRLGTSTWVHVSSMQ